MSNCHKNGKNKTFRQFKKIILNVILISWWLFIVITFFKQLLTITTYYFVFFKIPNYIYWIKNKNKTLLSYQNF